MGATRERQIGRLVALALAGVALLALGVLVVLGMFVAALGPLLVTAGAGFWARSMYADLRAEEIAREARETQREARERNSARVVTVDPPAPQYGPGA